MRLISGTTISERQVRILPAINAPSQHVDIDRLFSWSWFYISLQTVMSCASRATNNQSNKSNEGLSKIEERQRERERERESWHILMKKVSFHSKIISTMVRYRTMKHRSSWKCCGADVSLFSTKRFRTSIRTANCDKNQDNGVFKHVRTPYEASAQGDMSPQLLGPFDHIVK